MAKKLSELTTQNTSLNEGSDRIYTVKNGVTSGFSTPSDVKDAISTENGTPNKLIKVNANGDVYFSNDAYFRNSDNSFVGVTGTGGGGDLDTTYVTDNLTETYLQPYTPIKTLSDSIDSSLMLDGGLQNIKYNGLTLVNQAKNGNSGLSFTSNGNAEKLKLTHAGELVPSDNYDIFVQTIDVDVDDYIFIYARTKDNVIGTQIGIQYPNGNASVVSPVIDGVNEIFGKIQATSTTNVNFYILDNSSHIQRTSELESFFVINMTKNKIDSLEANTIMLMVRNKYFEGAASTNDIEIKFTGGNIIKYDPIYWENISGEEISLTYSNYEQGSYNIKSSVPDCRIRQKIDVELNQNYELTGFSSDASFELLDIKGATLLSDAGTFNSGLNDHVYVHMISPDNNGGQILNLQLYKGTAPQELEPYVESSLKINQEVLSIGTDISNYIYSRNGDFVLYKKLEKEYVEAGTELTRYRFTKSFTQARYMFIGNDGELISSEFDFTGVTYQAGLLIYELYAPEEIILSQQGKVLGTPIAYKNGRCQITSGTNDVVGFFRAEVPYNVGAQIKASSDSREMMIKQIAGITKNIIGIKDFTR